MAKVNRQFRVVRIVLGSLAAVILAFVLASVLTVAVVYLRGALLAHQIVRWQENGGYTTELGELNCSYHLDFVLTKGEPDHGIVYLDNGKSYNAYMAWYGDEKDFIIVIDGINGYFKFTGG